ncbi:MAG TPA: TIGR02996 domain-containing protein [Kofleriaceae bacterium]
MRRRFERPREVWQIELTDTELVTTTFLVGAPPFETRVPCEGRARGLFELELEVARRRGQGYLEVQDHVLRNPELEAALGDFEDPAAFLVYADWLQTRGDPRGELIAVQHGMRRAPTFEERDRCEAIDKTLREHYMPEWCGPAFARSTHHVSLGWELGFISYVKIDERALAGRRDGVPLPRDLIASLLGSPCGWRFRTFDIISTADRILDAVELLPTPQLRTIHARVEQREAAYLEGRIDHARFEAARCRVTIQNT